MFGNEHWSRCDFLSVNLPAIHVFHGILSLIGCGEFYVSEPSVQMIVSSDGGDLHRFHRSVDREYLRQVFPGNVASQTTDVDPQRFGSG